MTALCDMTANELSALYDETKAAYDGCREKGLKLDMSRGKPGAQQLALSEALLSLPGANDYMMDGVDTRNYGMLGGLPSAKRLFSEILDVSPDEVFVGGNSSLSLMFGVISKAFTHGLLLSDTPWSKLDKVRFLCPVPGYDRHFTISETFGMEMINVPMDESGPDMDAVEELIKDPSVKGIWCTPKYSNPAGIVYSESVLKRLAALRPAARDFVIMYDNAYCIHAFDGENAKQPDMLTLCREAGNPHMVIEFASTSKVTLPGAGISCFACSAENLAYLKKLISAESISSDKVNQMRHVLFLKDLPTTLAHMKKHAAIMKPKFDTVCELLDERVSPCGFISYHRPRGGYFISLDTMPGCAKRTHQLMKEAGVVMTSAGATYPYGKDPNDANLRIAPSFPPLDELRSAAEVLCVCLKLAALEKLLGK